MDQGVAGHRLRQLDYLFLYPAVRFMLRPQVAESSANEVPAGKKQTSGPTVAAFSNAEAIPASSSETEGGEWRAFSAVCTHLNCTVQYRPDTQQIWCACHNGLYDLNGKVIVRDRNSLSESVPHMVSKAEF